MKLLREQHLPLDGKVKVPRLTIDGDIMADDDLPKVSPRMDLWKLFQIIEGYQFVVTKKLLNPQIDPASLAIALIQIVLKVCESPPNRIF